MISVIKLVGRFQQKRKKKKKEKGYYYQPGIQWKKYLSGFILTKPYGAVTVLF